MVPSSSFCEGANVLRHIKPLEQWLAPNRRSLLLLPFFLKCAFITDHGTSRANPEIKIASYISTTYQILCTMELAKRDRVLLSQKLPGI